MNPEDIGSALKSQRGKKYIIKISIILEGLIINEDRVREI